VEHAEHCDALEVEIDRFATIYEGADDATMVPSCPEWSVHDLAEHLGHVHRWAEHLVRVRATARIPSSEMDFDRGPVSTPWIRSGGASLLVTLRNGNPDEPMWAWGADQHLRFWSRRQLHETFVHRIDLELAVGRTPVVDPLVASDAIDEFLVNLKSAGDFSPDVREIRGGSELIRIALSDVAGTWTIQLLENGFGLIDSTDSPHVELSGSAKDVLMVLLRRQAIAEVSVAVKGDRTLIDYWIANSAFE
jgi:uncharacterized protein (TIGR03083 family)